MIPNIRRKKNKKMVPNHQPVPFRVLHRFCRFFHRNSNRFEATRWVSWTRWRRRAARLSPWHRRKAAAALATSRRDSGRRGQVMIQLWLKPMDWSTGKIWKNLHFYNQI